MIHSLWIHLLQGIFPHYECCWKKVRRINFREWLVLCQFYSTLQKSLLGWLPWLPICIWISNISYVITVVVTERMKLRVMVKNFIPVRAMTSDETSRLNRLTCNDTLWGYWIIAREHFTSSHHEARETDAKTFNGFLVSKCKSEAVSAITNVRTTSDVKENQK